MIVVNFSTKEYSRGQQRLSNSLNGYKKLMLNDYVSINSPTHQQSPYEFKVHAIEKAFEFDNIVLWCDSSLWRVGDISKIERIIQKEGYFMEEAGHYCIDWCNDHCRKMLNYNAMGDEYHYTMFSAGLLGLDRNNPTASLWFEQWKEAAELGCFKGDWKDHRHDMTVGSILAQRLGMRYQRGGSHLSYVGPGYSEPEKDTVFLLQGI